MENQREFDLIIFGATGFTGFFMVRELLLTIEGDPAKYSTLKWAIAGRNAAKLDDTLVKLAQELNVNLSKVNKIKADAADPSSLLRMAERARVIVNGVGPYIVHGRQVVEACLQAGTHHIDISCEFQYVEGMQLEYDALARQNGTLIITNCGFGSTVTDMGVCYLNDHFDGGRLHSVESFFRMFLGPKKYTVNFGTLHSAVYLMANFFEYFRVHSRLYEKVLTKPLPRSRVSLPMHLLPFRKFSGWNLPYMAGDKETVMRSQHYNYQFFEERPVQFQPYFTFPSLLFAIVSLLFGAYIATLSLIKPLRMLLEKWPEVMTFGYFTKSGPTREQVETNHFETRFQGKGWSSSSLSDDDPHSEPVKPFDKEVTLVVTGNDAGYKTTSTCAIQAALTVLGDRENMPKGGVLTPGSAFRHTDLVKRLHMRDLKFKLM